MGGTEKGAAVDRMYRFLRTLTLLRDDVPSFEEYPFSIPAIRTLDELEFHPKVTFLVGENGSGKSTLIEAIAIRSGFNPEGGSKNFNFLTRSSESDLHKYLRLARGVSRQTDGFFLRAESYFNVGTAIDSLGVVDGYGGVSVHEQSHGESFLRLVKERFQGNGVYIMDEPEAALSPSRQLAFISLLDDLVRNRRSQFVIATHSPIIMAYPEAKILHFAEDGIREIAYEETEHYRITRDFLSNPHRFLRHLLGPDQGDA